MNVLTIKRETFFFNQTIKIFYVSEYKYLTYIITSESRTAI